MRVVTYFSAEKSIDNDNYFEKEKKCQNQNEIDGVLNRKLLIYFFI